MIHEDRKYWQRELTEAAKKLEIIQEKIDALQLLKRAVIHQYETALKKADEVAS